jgi:hypothetical protein
MMMSHDKYRWTQGHKLSIWKDRDQPGRARPDPAFNLERDLGPKIFWEGLIGNKYLNFFFFFALNFFFLVIWWGAKATPSPP